MLSKCDQASTFDHMCMNDLHFACARKEIGHRCTIKRLQVLNTPPGHAPVLSQEVVELLAPQPGSLIIDCTVGGGGHAAALLTHAQPNGRLIGIDRDPSALERAATRLAPFDPFVTLLHGNFGDTCVLVGERSLKEASLVLADIGVSSFHLDDPARGFTLRDPDAPLDMRMDTSVLRDAPRTFPRDDDASLEVLEGCTAAQVLASAPESVLRTIFATYGELPGTNLLARRIVEHRRTAPITTAGDLLALVPRRALAPQVFQALRIVVNGELRALERLLDTVPRDMSTGARIGIITFHSLEDRIVKHRFREMARDCICPLTSSRCTCGGHSSTLHLLTSRAVRPGPEELARNPRARSAHLRVAQRC